MRRNAALKAVFAFFSILAIWVGIKFIICMLTNTVFTLMAFSPLIAVSIVLAGLYNAYYVYKKNINNPGANQ